MTVYQHVMPGLQAQAASTFETAVFGQGRTHCGVSSFNGWD